MAARIDWDDVDVTVMRSSAHHRTWSSVIGYSEHNQTVESAGPLGVCRAYTVKQAQQMGVEFADAIRWRKVDEDTFVLQVGRRATL